jgi:hypothetical protein
MEETLNRRNVAKRDFSLAIEGATSRKGMVEVIDNST